MKIQVVACPSEFIFHLLAGRNYDLGVVEKAIFHGVDGSYEITSELLATPKSLLVEIEKAVFQGVAVPCEVIFCLLASPK